MKAVPAEKVGFKYVRVGKCDPKKCGAFCCRIGAQVIHFDNSKDDKDRLKYYEAVGMQHIGNFKGEKVYAYNIACKHLCRLRCGIHDKRPTICREFPSDPSQYWYQLAVANGCTYRFKKVKA